jgi:hypothetical protein
MATVRCLNCNTDNDPIQTAGYCEECGKKLPSGSSYAVDMDKPSGTFHRDDFRDPDKPSGTSYRDEFRDPYARAPTEDSPEVAAAKKQASGILFAVAAIQLICGGIGIVVLPMIDKQAAAPEVMVIGGALVVGMAAIFAGLGWWAMYMPLPASLIGLILYSLLALADFLVSQSMSGIFIKIIIVIGLVRAVAASIKARA